MDLAKGHLDYRSRFALDWTAMRIAEDVYGPREDGFGSNETVRLAGFADHDQARDALARVAARFMLIDETGHEHPDWEAVRALNGDPDSLSFASDPTDGRCGLYLYVDCRTNIEEPLRQRFIEVLEEELGSLKGDVQVETPSVADDPFRFA